jgi:type IV pilus assembly protein PilA
MRKHSHGFSLIELLIVVAIILIIAAIAIPNLLRARISANESSAVSSMRQINTGEFAYNTAFPNVGYTSNLNHLGGPSPCVPQSTSACLLDNVLATATPGSGGKSGYVFLVTGLIPDAAGVNTAFVSGASPKTFNLSGVRNFCGTEDGVLRYEAGPGAGAPVKTTAACIVFNTIQ